MRKLKDKPKVDLTGKRYGKLTVISFSCFKKIEYRNGRTPFFLCKCDCGNKKECNSYQLINGNTKSCGCIHHQLGERNSKWRGIGEISGRFWTVIKANAKVRNIPVEISHKDIWNLFLNQNRKCAISGVNISLGEDTVNKVNRTASLDRKDPRYGYVNGNVQWVHKDVNFMKQDFTQEEFLEWCRKIVTHSKG